MTVLKPWEFQQALQGQVSLQGGHALAGLGGLGLGGGASGVYQSDQSAAAYAKPAERITYEWNSCRLYRVSRRNRESAVDTIPPDSVTYRRLAGAITYDEEAGFEFVDASVPPDSPDHVMSFGFVELAEVKAAVFTAFALNGKEKA